MIASKAEVVRRIRETRKTIDGRGYTYFVAHVGSDPITGRRIDIVRNSRAALMDAINDYYAVLRAGVMPGDVDAALNPKDIAEVRAAREKLGGTSIVEAADIIARAKEVLADAGLADITILDAVASFAGTKTGVKRTTLAAAFDAYLATFNAEQETYRKVIKTRVGRMVVELGAERLVSDITPTEAMDWVERSFGGLSEKTYNNYLGDCRTFFNWCAKPVRAYCRENPLASAEKRKEAKKRPEFMPVDDVKKWFSILLASACDEKSKMILWWNALGFFAGARTAEIHRLKWKDVDLDKRTVLFAEPKGFAHGVPPRFVKLNDAAMAWLTAAPPTRHGPDDLVFASVDETRAVSNYLAVLAKKNGIILPKNAARHTFITMHATAFHDAALTESIVGTSSTMRRSHYQGLVREEEAKRYFEEIRP